ncbi:hypothetical protein [Salaquimonas pukyongi]|uniref:hypothetical protein n=1 Tax=Salaquimonas pukyongi TaxID=2712698 RepID=UPI001967A631|nr:hypothetical protein [Salaquimonas pukyongi]
MADNNRVKRFMIISSINVGAPGIIKYGSPKTASSSAQTRLSITNNLSINCQYNNDETGKSVFSSALQPGLRLERVLVGWNRLNAGNRVFGKAQKAQQCRHCQRFATRPEGPGTRFRRLQKTKAIQHGIALAVVSFPPWLRRNPRRMDKHPAVVFSLPEAKNPSIQTASS